MVLTIVFSTPFRKRMNFAILFFSLVITLNFYYFLVFSYFGNFFIFYTLFINLLVTVHTAPEHSCYNSQGTWEL